MPLIIRRIQQLSSSLTIRVFTFSTLMAIVALIVVATVISTLYRQASERNFDSLLSARLFHLIGSISIDQELNISNPPNLGDLRYSIPNSGWYWVVESLDGDESSFLNSPSMSAPIEAPGDDEVPFNDDFQRTYIAQGPDDELLRVVESEVVAEPSGNIIRFRQMGSESEFQQDLSNFRITLWTYLGFFGFGIIVVNCAAIYLALRPLERMRDALTRIRKGEAQRLEGTMPYEIAPMAQEMNALIENNRRIVERSRTQVGNLAHSLKTPLSVLINEGRTLNDKTGDLIVEQSQAMRAQVEHYLQRARIAAQRDSIVFRTEVSPVLARMVRVMQKINLEKDFALSLPQKTIIFAGERQDFEEIFGNLLENAAKWSNKYVRVNASVEGEVVHISVEDDGPGIPQDKALDALKRGRRLDETKPGTGLGLSIVVELVNEYGGELKLARSSSGGLDVKVTLPCVG